MAPTLARKARAETSSTVWGRKRPGPAGSIPDFTLPHGLGFLQFTRDGGALAGGRLWRRNGDDTLTVIAIKVSREDIVGVIPRDVGRRPGKARPGSGLHTRDGFDAAGWDLEAGRSPLLTFPRRSPPSPD